MLHVLCVINLKLNLLPSNIYPYTNYIIQNYWIIILVWALSIDIFFHRMDHNYDVLNHNEQQSTAVIRVSINEYTT